MLTHIIITNNPIVLFIKASQEIALVIPIHTSMHGLRRMYKLIFYFDQIYKQILLTEKSYNCILDNVSCNMRNKFWNTNHLVWKLEHY